MHPSRPGRRPYSLIGMKLNNVDPQGAVSLCAIRRRAVWPMELGADCVGISAADPHSIVGAPPGQRRGWSWVERSAPAYGTLAVAGAEAPTELVSVTVTEAIVETFPLMVNGSISENCEPVASDAGF